jgi:hypothetical protein
MPDTGAIRIIHIRPVQSPIGIREGTAVRVSRPSSQILVITESRLPAIGWLAVYLGFFSFWYYFTLDLGKIPEGARLFDHVHDRLSAEPSLWLFVLSPVFFIPYIFKGLRIAVIGEKLTFNGMTTTVLKNRKRLAGFNEIAYLQIRTIRGKSEAHRLTAALQTGDKVEIYTSDNAHEIMALADDAADILGVRVVRKD